MKQIIFIFFFCSIICLSYLSCEKCTECPDEDESTNHAPIVSEILISPTPSPSISYYTVTAIGTDEDGDSLSCFWNVSSGGFDWTFGFTATSNPTKWYLPDSGNHSIKVIMSDGMDLDSLSKVITK